MGKQTVKYVLVIRKVHLTEMYFSHSFITPLVVSTSLTFFFPLLHKGVCLTAFFNLRPLFNQGDQPQIYSISRDC